MIDTILLLLVIGISLYTLYVVRNIKSYNLKDITCRYPDTDQQKALIDLEFNKAKELEREIDRLKKLEVELLRKKVNEADI